MKRKETFVELALILTISDHIWTKVSGPFLLNLANIANKENIRVTLHVWVVLKAIALYSNCLIEYISSRTSYSSRERNMNCSKLLSTLTLAVFTTQGLTDTRSWSVYELWSRGLALSNTQTSTQVCCLEVREYVGGKVREFSGCLSLSSGQPKSPVFCLTFSVTSKKVLKLRITFNAFPCEYLCFAVWS